jgi:hypothetical protein
MWGLSDGFTGLVTEPIDGFKEKVGRSVLFLKEAYSLPSSAGKACSKELLGAVSI